MPLLKYFLIVGTILTAGLFALSAYFEPQASATGARVSVTPTTASLVAVAPAAPAAKPANDAAATVAQTNVPVAPPPQKTRSKHKAN
jgi:hypothetical protein